MSAFRGLLLLLATFYNLAAAAPSCQNIAATRSDDFSHILGNVDYYDPASTEQDQSSYRWLVNGVPLSSGLVSELLLLHFEGNLKGASNDNPSASSGVAYGTGRWGQGLALENAGRIEYPRARNLRLEEGTIEMWVAPRVNGDSSIYESRWHPFFYYYSGSDWMAIVQGNDGVLYAGGQVSGQWQSAYSGAANMRYWPAGQWHHIAYTYSQSQNFMRFYLDGVLMADTNESHYWPPAAGGIKFYIGTDRWSSSAYYTIDHVRILDHATTHAEIAALAGRTAPAKPFEIKLDSTVLNSGDSVMFEFTPSNGSQTGTPCQSTAMIWSTIPLKDPHPVSTLLPPNTVDHPFSVTSIAPTQCRYSVAANLPYAQMTPFDAGAGTTSHQTMLRGLNSDPNTVNEVYVRCASDPDYVLHLRYRCLSAVNPSFPRKGNLWGSGAFLQKGLDYCAKIDLWLGAAFSAEQIRQLRQKNADILVLTSINAVENGGLDDSYYLKDIYGNKVQTWPGSYRLNLTKPHVAEYQAQYAYEKILNNDLMFDGCFFDNVMTTQSWQNKDIYGNPFLADADEDGIADDPTAFDAAWKAGVFYEMQVFRQLMPYALVSGHSMDIFEPGISDLFNGLSIGFWTADVLEEQEDFSWLWNRYQAWNTQAVQPHMTMIESSPLDPIAYGYGYAPWNTIPPSTLQFARDDYPQVRFGLAFTLMQDGYFAHELGDTWHGNDWWYDELDFDLGYPLGQAEFIECGQSSTQNLVNNAGFESSLSGTWNFWVNAGTGCTATLTRDTADKVQGSASARISITQASGVDWHIELNQTHRTFVKDTPYQLSFWAKSSIARYITVGTQKQSPDWDNFGLSEQVMLTTDWQKYTVSFTANASTTESRLQFMVGQSVGTVWIDDIVLRQAPDQLMRRKFSNGLVLLNTSRNPLEYETGVGYRRLRGSQASRFEYILDNGTPIFSTTGTWDAVVYDSGL